MGGEVACGGATQGWEKAGARNGGPRLGEETGAAGSQREEKTGAGRCSGKTVGGEAATDSGPRRRRPQHTHGRTLPTRRGFGPRPRPQPRWCHVTVSQRLVAFCWSSIPFKIQPHWTTRFLLGVTA